MLAKWPSLVTSNSPVVSSSRLTSVGGGELQGRKDRGENFVAMVEQLESLFLMIKILFGETQRL